MKNTDDSISRRAVLVTSGAAVTTLAGCMQFESDSDDDPDEGREGVDEWETGDMNLIRLAAQSDGWAGMGQNAPTDTNPPLRLQEGNSYEIIWENRDGLQHELILADATGEELLSTEPASERAVVRSLEFEARDGFATYYCRFHPSAMRGDIEVGGAEWGS